MIKQTEKIIRRFAGFWALVFCICVPLYAETLPIPSEVRAEPQPEPKWSVVKRVVESGEYIKAREMYESFLQEAELSEEESKKLENDYAELNWQILFSRTVTSDSEIYEVVKGDTLYEIAKKFKTTVGLIQQTNGLSGHLIYPGMKLKIAKGVFDVLVDKSDNKLALYFNGRLLKYYSVATGKDNITPVGEFEIINKLENPTWFHAGAVVPPDSPENILGTRWLGFDYAGYGIHGTTMPETLGKQMSAGCIRMRNEEVEELYAIVPTGAKVRIQN